MQNLMSNPKKILDYIGSHVAKARRVPQRLPFLFIKDGEDYYCLKVSGDSMSDELSESEEMVLVRRTERIKDDDIIVGVVDGQPMLKRYKKFEDRIELHAANAIGHPLILTDAHDFRVAGIFVGHFNER